MKTHFKYIAITLCAVVIGAVAGIVVAKPQWLGAVFWFNTGLQQTQYINQLIAVEKGEGNAAQAEAYAQLWLEKDERGWPYYEVAGAYATGESGLPKNAAKGLQWMKRSAELNFLAAENVLYNLHVTKKHALPMQTALRYATDLAEAGRPNPQYYLAYTYMYAPGVPHNPQKAFYWAKEAAGQGHISAKKMLVDLYRLGYGTQPDTVKAQRMETQMRENGVHFSTSYGSGFSPSKGYFVTNHHVVDGCKELEGVYGDVRFPLEVVTVTKDQDLALLHSSDSKAGAVVTLPIAPDYEIQKGEQIFSAGFSGEKLRVKAATVVNPDFRGWGQEERQLPYDAILFTASVNHGDSGGPIVDTTGKVVAVTSLLWSKDEKGKIPLYGGGVKLGDLRALLAPHLVAYSQKNFHKPEKLSQSNRKRLEQGTLLIGCAS